MGCRADPSACVYRPKVRRTRARRSTSNHPTRGVNSVSLFSEVIEPLHSPSPGETEITNSALCREVTAAHNFPHFAGHLEISYGPASSFAFLQHVHRAISSHDETENAGRPLDEGGLDRFAMRGVFFGLPPRISLQAISVQDTIHKIIRRPSALKFLDTFKTFSLHIFPFFTSESLDELLDRAYSPTSSIPRQSHDEVVLLAILASGSLNAAETNEAERLFQHATRHAESSGDAVTLPTIQFSLLMADYQLNMGRPNAAYLLISAACCKAYALGLHRFSTQVALSEQEIQVRRATLWTIFSYDRQVITPNRQNDPYLM
ncbi:hypothetical protein FOZG_17042 [Fusarium oxysporum Fo47]|uniref:Xylanolytic transcriptional activator regulatory domain-containing protein n=1 Tax=Fusarium oxysporum Fo47 TaxID=660027 RepID=W9JJ29_FUSOX|nr:hypothetical protein FOZG_17042 [Fusarium oxysporum Fo47]